MKTNSKEEFWKFCLCRGSINSVIDIHKSSLEFSHLFGTTSLDSYLTQNHNFYWKLKKMQTDQDMVACYLRKWNFDSKDSKWIFKMHFNEEHFKKRFLFKRKEIIRKQQYTRIKQRQPRRRQIFKVKFLTTNQNQYGESRSQPSWVFDGPQELNLTNKLQSK